MSCVIKTITPFLNEELLLQALQECKCQFQKQGEHILVHPTQFSFGYLRGACFYKDSMGKFVLEHDSHMDVQSFLRPIEQSYQKAYQRKVEELERQRAEAEKSKLELEQKKMLEERRKLELAQKKAEEEQQRLEAERQQYVEKQKQSILQKAKELGYDVQETKKANKIQLVLVRRTS